MSAHFTDYKASYARKHADTLDPETDGRLFAEPPPVETGPEDLPLLRQRISDVHNATCNGFATLGLPLKLRVLVALIIGASRGETKFKASYKTLVGLLFRQGDGRTFEAKKSEVRRLLEALRKWQEETKITLCTITQGGRTKDENGKKEYHDTEFDLIFLDAIAKAMQRNTDPDKMRAAVRMEIAAMMKIPPFDARWRVKAPTPDELQRREHKAAVSMALKAARRELERSEELRGDPLRYAEQLAREIVAAARREFGGDTPYQEGIDESPSVEIEEFEIDPPVSDSTHPPTPVSRPVDQEIAPKEKRYKVLFPDELLLPRQTREPTPEDVAAWQQLEARASGRSPAVQLTTVAVLPRGTPSSDGLSVEDAEAAAIQLEASGRSLEVT